MRLNAVVKNLILVAGVEHLPAHIAFALECEAFDVAEFGGTFAAWRHYAGHTPLHQPRSPGKTDSVVNEKN